MKTDIFIAATDAEIAACFDCFSALRPQVKKNEFLARVRRQEVQNYRILALRHEGVVKSAAGFRFADFLAWGKVLYVDDLTTLPGERGHGFAASLLDWLIAHARERGCDGLHLDSGYARHAAHRLYLRAGLKLNCHHFALDFAADG